MSDTRKEQLSALLDGELDDHEGMSTLGDMADDAALKVTWHRYQLIGDAMRGGLSHVHDVDIVDTVRTGLRDEPVILAPVAARSGDGLLKPIMGFALAASVAVVAVMGVFSLNGTGNAASAPGLALQAPAPSNTNIRLASEASKPLPADAEARLRSYLLDHMESANGRVPGMLPRARIVIQPVEP